MAIVNDHALDRIAAETLRRRLRGTLLAPGDAGYDTARLVWNGRIDRHPALIARCADTGDVVAAVAFARQHELDLAVRGGGHSAAGFGTCDGGLVIDLSTMKEVQVDAARRTARVGPGVTIRDFLEATLAAGLAAPTGVGTTTGLVGSALGGGIGWLSGLYGLTCDNLLAAELVTADGQVLTTSARERPELFWALRGGGGNFGVVTALELRLHPVGPVWSGPLLHPAARAPEVLRFYRTVTAGSPDALTVDLGFLTGPDGRPAVALLPCYAGAPAAAEPTLAPIRAFGPPIADLLRPMSILEANAPVDEFAPAGRRYGFRSQVLARLDDVALEVLAAFGAALPTPLSNVIVRHVHGAATRVPVEATAFALRTDHYVVEIGPIWIDADATAACLDWAARLAAALAPFPEPGTHVNFLGDDGDERVRVSYGPNYARLVEVKRRYDPTNVFRLNPNIVP